MASALLAVLVTASPLAHSAGNPSKSIHPTQAFARACYDKPAPTSYCNKQAILNINKARAKEGLAAISLPGNFARLPVDAQIVAVGNAERTSRGLSAVTETSSDDTLAQQGADNMTDPDGPPGKSWGSNWAGIADPLAADFLWMYDDGPGGVNGDCQHAGDPGCWGHRDNILGAPWTTTGAGFDGASLAQLFVH